MGNNARGNREQVIKGNKILGSKKVNEIKDFSKNKYKHFKGIKNIEHQGF